MQRAKDMEQRAWSLIIEHGAGGSRQVEECGNENAECGSLKPQMSAGPSAGEGHLTLPFIL